MKPKIEISDLNCNFEDVHDEAIGDSSEGNPVVYRNLLRVIARLQLLAELIDRADSDLDPASIVAASFALYHYRGTLPQILDDQLEAAYGWLPVGMLQDQTVCTAVDSILYPTSPKNREESD
jgi:hypothetical protein